MKIKILLLILSTTSILSCSKDSLDDCGCVKTVYDYEQYTTINSAGLPVLGFHKVVISEENIPCNDEVEQVSNSDGTYYDIVCH